MMLAADIHVADPHVALSGVHAHIGRYHILHGVDFAVPQGKVTMLLGRNGAGKSTTVKTLMGIVNASAGTITVKGQKVADQGLQWTIPRIARLGIGYVPEDMGVFTQLTVRQNLELAAFSAGSLRNVDPGRIDWLLGLFPFLKDAWHVPAGTLSGGQRQMLSIARAIVEPKNLLIIDEPSKGLAPVMVRSMINALIALKETKVTMLLVEQNMAVANAVGDAAVVLDGGRVTFRGSVSEFACDSTLQRSLVGLHLRRVPARVTS